MSFLSKAVKSVAAPVKKVASVAVNTAAGFAAGGNVGALAGATRGVYENTKTGRAETINLRTVGQAAVTGGVANIVAGTVAAGVVHAGGAAGIVGKATAFGKSGGLAGNLGNLVKGTGSLISKGLPVFAGLLAKGGSIPGTTLTSGQAMADNTALAEKVKSGYKKVRNEIDGNPAVKSQVEKFSKQAKNIPGYNNLFPGYPQQPSNGSGSPIVVNTPGGSGGGFDLASAFPIAALALGAYFLFIKK